MLILPKPRQRQDLYKLTSKWDMIRAPGMSCWWGQPHYASKQRNMFDTESQLQHAVTRVVAGIRDAAVVRVEGIYVSPHAHLPFLLAGGLEDLRRRIVVYPILGHTTKHLARSCTHEWGDRLVLPAMWFIRNSLSLAERTEACSQHTATRELRTRSPHP